MAEGKRKVGRPPKPERIENPFSIVEVPAKTRERLRAFKGMFGFTYGEAIDFLLDLVEVVNG